MESLYSYLTESSFKKVDFVKRASIIFMGLEIQEVISMSLSFFMDVFSADAVCAIYQNTFHGIGINEDDLSDIADKLFSSDLNA